MATPDVGQVPGRLIDWAAGVVGIPAGVVAAQLNEESGGDPAAVSPTGAEGVAQFEPGTWQGLGCGGSPTNVNNAMTCYAKYMYQLVQQYHGNIRDALAAYNAGPGDLAAGYGYADTILGNAGEKTTLTSAGGSGQAANQPGTSSGTCLIGFGGVSIPLIGNVGSACFLPKHTGRAFIGIMLMTAGAFIALPGVAMIMIDVGLRAAGPIGGAAQRTGRVVSWVAPEAGAAMSAAGSAASRGRRPQRQAPAPEVREAQQASRTRVREQARTTPAQGRHATDRERRGRGGRHAAPGPAT
jgi:hypothetical protein